MIDFGAIFSELFSSFWWLPLLFVLIALLKSAWLKGMIGEAMVNLAARLFLDKNYYHLIKNVTIPTEDGVKAVAICDHLWKSGEFPLLKTINLRTSPLAL